MAERLWVHGQEGMLYDPRYEWFRWSRCTGTRVESAVVQTFGAQLLHDGERGVRGSPSVYRKPGTTVLPGPEVGPSGGLVRAGAVVPRRGGTAPAAAPGPRGTPPGPAPPPQLAPPAAASVLTRPTSDLSGLRQRLGGRLRRHPVDRRRGPAPCALRRRRAAGPLAAVQAHLPPVPGPCPAHHAFGPSGDRPPHIVGLAAAAADRPGGHRPPTGSQEPRCPPWDCGADRVSARLSPRRSLPAAALAGPL